MKNKDLARLVKFRDMICEAYQAVLVCEAIDGVNWEMRNRFLRLVGVMVNKELRRKK